MSRLFLQENEAGEINQFAVIVKPPVKLPLALCRHCFSTTDAHRDDCRINRETSPAAVRADQEFRDETRRQLKIFAFGLCFAGLIITLFLAAVSGTGNLKNNRNAGFDNRSNKNARQ